MARRQPDPQKELEWLVQKLLHQPPATWERGCLQGVPRWLMRRAYWALTNPRDQSVYRPLLAYELAHHLENPRVLAEAPWAVVAGTPPHQSYHYLKNAFQLGQRYHDNNLMQLVGWATLPKSRHLTEEMARHMGDAHLLQRVGWRYLESVTDVPQGGEIMDVLRARDIGQAVGDEALTTYALMLAQRCPDLFAPHTDPEHPPEY